MSTGPADSPLTSPLDVSGDEDNPGFKSSFEHVMDDDKTTHPGAVAPELHNETQPKAQRGTGPT